MEGRGQYLSVVNGGGAAPPATAPASVRGMAVAPVVDPIAFLQRRAALNTLFHEVMLPDVDYGIIPGTPKPSLYRPGAEKILEMYGMTLGPFGTLEVIEQWDEHNPFLYYKYEARILYGDALIASAIGIAHSKETKYAYRWVPEHEVPRFLDKAELEVREGRVSEYAFAVRKMETTGKYGKPAEYWAAFNDAIAARRAKSFKKPMGKEEKDAWEIDTTVYRIPNPQVPDLAHTLSAMAQKRAAVLATRWAVPGVTDIFEVNERVETGEVDIIDGMYSYVTEQGRAEDQERLERAKNGTLNGRTVTKEDAEKAKEELFGGPVKKNGATTLHPADEIRKAFGQLAKGKDVPPNKSDFDAMVVRLQSLSIDVDKFSATLFNTPPGGLSEAHVKAIMAASNDQLKRVLE